MKAMNTIAIIILLHKFTHIFFVYKDQLQIPNLKPVIIVKNGASKAKQVTSKFIKKSSVPGKYMQNFKMIIKLSLLRNN